MADPATAGQSVTALTTQLFGSGTSLWNCTRNMCASDGSILKGIGTNLGALSQVGLAIGFLCLCVQLILDLVGNTYGGGINPMKFIQKNLVKVLFVGILLNPVTYQFFTINFIAKPCDLMSEGIMSKCSDKFLESSSNIFNVLGKSNSKSSSIFTDGFVEQLATSFFATIIYIIAAAFTFVMPLLQSTLFLFAVYLGPLCIPFLLCDLTATIAKNWISFILSIGFWSVVGSITYLVSDTANLQSQMALGGGLENVFLIVVYGVITIILYAMSYPISAFLFNAGGTLGHLSDPRATVAGASNLIKSGGAMGAGALAKRFEAAGNKALDAGKTELANKNFGRAGTAYAAANTMQTGSRGEFKAKATEMQKKTSGSKSGYSPNV